MRYLEPSRGRMEVSEREGVEKAQSIIKPSNERAMLYDSVNQLATMQESREHFDTYHRNIEKNWHKTS